MVFGVVSLRKTDSETTMTIEKTKVVKKNIKNKESIAKSVMCPPFFSYRRFGEHPVPTPLPLIRSGPPARSIFRLRSV